MGELDRLVEQDVLHDETLQRVQRRGYVLCIGIGLCQVLALHVHAQERAVQRGVEHVRNAQARLGVELDLPVVLEQGAHHGIGNVTIARKLMREGAHVARALHVVLAAQRVHADALASEVAGDHGDWRCR
jgi:hypothetical protein